MFAGRVFETSDLAIYREAVGVFENSLVDWDVFFHSLAP